MIQSDVHLCFDSIYWFDLVINVLTINLFVDEGRGMWSKTEWQLYNIDNLKTTTYKRSVYEDSKRQ